MHALEPDGLRGRNHDAAHVRIDRAALEHGCCRTHVLDAAVRAGADDRLVDCDMAGLCHRMRVGGQMRPGDRRHDILRIDPDDLLVCGIGVCMVFLPGALRPAFEPGTCHIVDLEEASLAACLDGHVRDREPALDREVPDRGASKLHRAVERAVDADLADDVEDDVLGRGTFRKLALDLEADGLRHLEPGPACCHAYAGIRRADACREGTDAAVGAGMGVGADDEVSRADDALLGQQGMLDAHAALLEVVGDPHLMREVARDLRLLGALDVLVRAVVVGHEENLGPIEDASAKLADRLDRDRCRDVICEHAVEVALDELSWHDTVEAGMRGQDLLCHRHSLWHSLPSFLAYACSSELASFERSESTNWRAPRADLPPRLVAKRSASRSSSCSSSAMPRSWASLCTISR